MAKFDKVKSSAKEVQQKEAVKSNVAVTVVNLLLKDLILDPNNGEDISNTEDLEYSIGRFGFRGTIEVTPFGCPDGKYMIISGHRRFATLQKLGYESVACMVYDFKSENDISDYNQCMNNGTRDSAKDPMLWLRRYPNNRATLLAQNPKMSEAELDAEIAKRFGQSVQQIGRYKALCKVIPTALELAREGKVGIFSLVPLSPLKEEQQNEVYNILVDALTEQNKDGEGESLTRPLVADIVKAYNKGKGVKTWEEYKALKETPSTNGEAEATAFDGMNPPSEEAQTEENGNDVADTDNNSNGGSGADTEKEDDLSDKDSDGGDGEAKERKKAREIVGLIKKLDTALQESFTFDTDEDTIVAIGCMGKLVEELTNEMNNIAMECTDGGWDAFMKAKASIIDTLNSYE